MPANWCDKELRAGLKGLNEIKTNRQWFKVYDVGHQVFAIIEPYNYQEVISYLIIGKEKALLFDTGMGLDSISLLEKELTKLPITVLNSHTHFDHIGGNHEFVNVLALNTDYTKKSATNGWDHETVKEEVTPQAFCSKYLPAFDTSTYRIRPFTITKFINAEDSIDLGERKIKVIAVPGHSPDAIALLDSQAGYLWTGDSFYEGPIFLFAEGTDIDAYEQSIAKLSVLSTHVKTVLPSHNLPIAEPSLLVEIQKAFAAIRRGNKKGKETGDGIMSFEFEQFSFLIRKGLLKSK